MPHYEHVSDYTLDRIRALLDEGLAPVLIGERLGVAQQTIYDVRDGRARAARKEAKPSEPDRWGIRYFNRMAEPIWCDVCKAYVYPPCLACQVRGVGKKSRT